MQAAQIGASGKVEWKKLHSCQAAMWPHVGTLNSARFSFNMCVSNRFSCSTEFFHLKIAIGLALHESWGVACVTTEEH